MIKGIGIRFDNGPKLHYIKVDAEMEAFLATHPSLNQWAVVECRRGLEIARLRTEVLSLSEDTITIGTLLRVATEADLELNQERKAKAADLKWLMRARVREDRLKVKIVNMELDLEEKNLVVSYYAENQVQLRPYLSVLGEYTSARIEFRSVGARDQVRIIGALGTCGDGSCSSTWLQGFHSVSIKMARDQQLPLNANKISGPCGRLMCCLIYEHPMYEALLEGMPQRGARMCSKKHGTCGTITKIHPLTQTVELRHKKGREELPVDDLIPFYEGYHDVDSYDDM